MRIISNNGANPWVFCEENPPQKIPLYVNGVVEILFTCIGAEGHGIIGCIPSSLGQWRVNGMHPWWSRAGKWSIGKSLVVWDRTRVQLKPSLYYMDGQASEWPPCNPTFPLKWTLQGTCLAGLGFQLFTGVSVAISWFTFGLHLERGGLLTNPWWSRTGFIGAYPWLSREGKRIICRLLVV